MSDELIPVDERQWNKIVDQYPHYEKYVVSYDDEERYFLIKPECPYNFETSEVDLYNFVKDNTVLGHHRKRAQEQMDEPKIKDSGTRSTFETGAVRDGQTGKGRRDLLPMRALLELSKHFEAGSFKYGDRNWEKGIPLHTYCSSCMNHLFKFMIGYKDEPHLTAALWNLICLVDTVIRIKEGSLPESLNTLPIDLDEVPLHWRKDD